MRLQDECKDMMEVLLAENAETKFWTMEEDTGVFLCPIHNYQDTMMLWGDVCDTCTERQQCKEEFVPVDLTLSISDLADEEDGGTYYLNFVKEPKKQEHRNTIRYISNRKELVALMTELKQRNEKNRNLYAACAKKIMNLQDYGSEFLKQIKRDYPVFRKMRGNIPLSFSGMSIEKDGQTDYACVGGFEVINGEYVTIHIFDMWQKEEKMKQTIRHEVLHYALFCIQVNYDDDSGIFHYFCGQYDARAYKEMPEKERRVYETLQQLSREEVSEILEVAEKM